MRPAEVQRAERAWFTRNRNGLDAADANGTRGTGLGLALVRTVAEAHGGSVGVRSMPGEGSEFEIALPAPPQGQG